MKNSSARPFWQTMALAVAIAAVLGATLGPGPASSSTPGLCIVCGERGAADAIANIILFVPLGIALALQAWRVRAQVLFAAGVTILIESAQINLIPGRDASLGDIVFNTAGAAVGMGLVRFFRLWIQPPRTLRPFLQISAGLIAALTVVLTGILTQPQLDSSRYRSLWTRRVSDRQQAGQLDSVHLGGLPLEPGWLDEADVVDDSMGSGRTLMIRGTATLPLDGSGPILIIRDHRDQDVLSTGRVRDDLVFGYRTIAQRHRFSPTRIQLPDAMAQIRPGDPLVLDIRRSSPGFNIVVGGMSHHVAYRARDGWQLIFPTYARPAWFDRSLGFFWIAALLFPLGLWMNRQWPTAAGFGAVALAVIGVPAIRLLGAPGWTELTGIVFGLATGLLVQRWAARHLVSSQNIIQAPSVEGTASQAVS